MERAKRIATAFIGVAFVANYCEPANAQTPDRFIRQPAKAPVTPVPSAVTPPAPAATAPATTTPVSPTLAPSAAIPSTDSPQPTGTPAQGTPASSTVTPAEKPTDALGLDSSKLDLGAPAPAAKPSGLLNFPSLLPLTSTPDLSFDSLESLATVPDLELEKPAKQNKQLEVPATESSVAANVPEASPTSTNFSASAPNRTGQLQWTSRASGNRTRTEMENSPSQFDANNNRNSPSFNARSSSNTHRDFPREATKFDSQSSATNKQQADANNELLTRIANDFESIKSKVNKEEEPEKESRIRASLVSARITNDPRFASQSAEQTSVTRIESPQGWQAIGTRLSHHVRKCESLLGRGAFCSAREEAETASMLLYRHIDLHDNLFRCEPAVQSANQALREAEDFLATMRSTADGESLRRLVDAHETPVLKNKNLSGMSPLTAAQHYRQYAESKLVEAAQGHPWASELLYTVGRTYQAEADSNSSRVDALRMKAMAYYLAARTTLPTNAVACNQLGYLLLQMDRNPEAREALVAAVTLKQDEAYLSNLAEASRRLGDIQTVTWATQSVAAIRSRTPPPSPVPPYVEVSQEDFIAISPREIGPKTQAEASVVPVPKTADRSSAAPNSTQLLR